MQDTLSKESLEVLYAGAYHFYKNGKYMEAIHHFRFLTLQQPEAAKFWMGLGASYQMANAKERAIQCYACANHLTPEDPYPHLYAAECFGRIGDVSHTRDALEHARRLAEGRRDKEKILSKIAVIRDTYEQKEGAIR